MLLDPGCDSAIGIKRRTVRAGNLRLSEAGAAEQVDDLLLGVHTKDVITQRQAVHLLIVPETDNDLAARPDDAMYFP